MFTQRNDSYSQWANQARWALLALTCAFASAAQALPSFASQTGMPCQQCHTVGFGPALTAYGRQFKLNGYVWGDGSPMPLALMIQGGYTHTGDDQPAPPADHTSVNNNLSLDQVSLFYGGRISEHTGALAQATYTGSSRTFHWDNLDVRHARQLSLGASSLVLGVSLNNNPTIQDLWNSTPGWGFPYISSALAPTPAAKSLLSSLAQSVIGATGYAMLNDRYYFEAGGYRSVSDRWLSKLGLGSGASSNIAGVAPYARATVQWDGPTRHTSLGLIAMDARIAPDPTSALRDRYTDVGFDATYQYAPAGDHQFGANAALTREHRSLAASVAATNAAAPSSNLTFVTFEVTYAYARTWAATVGGFDTRGSSDPVLYSGSLSGSPDSQGYTLQLEYIPFGKKNSFARPWLNVRTGLQYVGYTKFDGGTANYDGSGRSASANNTLFAYLWIII